MTAICRSLSAIADGKTTDIEAGRVLAFPAGSIVACDRGYTDYGWYNQLTQKGIFFATRLKKNANTVSLNVARLHAIRASELTTRSSSSLA